MSVRVRLTRVGSKQNPIWRVVVADQRSPRDGRVIEQIGRYNPRAEPSEVVLDTERLQHWLARGAQPTATVKRLIRIQERTEAGEPLPAAAKTTPKKSKPAPAPEAPAAEEPAAEAPAEEAAAEAAPAEEAPAEEAAPDEPAAAEEPAAGEAEAAPAEEPEAEPAAEGAPSE